MKIILYEEKFKYAWDNHVIASKNGTFLHRRDYMEYHGARFTDMSLLVTDQKQQIHAILPANRKEETLATHEGLTYGGFIYNQKITQPHMLDIFAAALEFLYASGIRKIFYKTIPSVYHRGPAEEDLYPLFLLNARLARRDTLTVIDNLHRPIFQTRRNRMIQRASRLMLKVERSFSFDQYWNILEKNLSERYQTQPAHSLHEIQSLAALFPDNIKLYCVYRKNDILAGVVIYETDTVAHLQYIAASVSGKSCGALDWLFSHLIQEVYSEKRYIDFGISNENQGRKMNQGLIEFKEGFGGRTISHDFYQIDLLPDSSCLLKVAI